MEAASTITVMTLAASMVEAKYERLGEPLARSTQAGIRSKDRRRKPNWVRRTDKGKRAKRVVKNGGK